MSLAKNRMMKWTSSQQVKGDDAPPWKRKMNAAKARAVAVTPATDLIPVASGGSLLALDTGSVSDPTPDSGDAPNPDISLLTGNVKTVIFAVQAGEADAVLAALALAEKADKNRKTVNEALEARKSVLKALN